ncbi:hypothetical protein ACFLWA_12530 [Chloroflexota bacterium]
MKHWLWILLVIVLLVGCGPTLPPATPALEDYALVAGDLPEGYRQTVEENSLQYLKLLVPEEARVGLTEASAVGFEIGPGAGTIRSLLYAYESETDAVAAFNTLQPSDNVQALPELGPEVYLHEPTGLQPETVVTFRAGNVVGSVSASGQLSEGLADPRQLTAQLAAVILERLGK